MKTNKLPQGLVTLENIFNTDDQQRRDKGKISNHIDNYEQISVEDGKSLHIGK
ncbi:hypothetical protein KI387_007849, partial [Taxus chinensis]